MCEDPAAPIPVIGEYVNATIPVMEGVHRGCDEAETRSGELEFIPAVRIALEEDRVEERWLAGEDVFDGAVDLYLRDYVNRNIPR